MRDAGLPRSCASSITTTPACRSPRWPRARSARLKGLKPGDAGWPESAYNGDYIADIAADFLAKKTVQSDDRQFTASGDPEDLDGIRQFAVAYLRHEQDLDLQAFGVQFDHYYLESSLYTGGRVEDTVSAWSPPARPTRKDGALWLRRPITATTRTA
jgi:arginyl-tRNA synthetase